LGAANRLWILGPLPEGKRSKGREVDSICHWSFE
jgi:hypothetical protein